jgi:serine/threonine protein kinase
MQFCDGMSYVLSMGVSVHRDIKPQNCLITQENDLKVTDFGLAKVFDDTKLVEPSWQGTECLSIGLTRTGVAAGTCTHMAPEQFEDSKRVDVRADVYSFGVMLYQMATGSLPFVARTPEEYEQLHRQHSAPALVGHMSMLDAIVARCLAKDPKAIWGLRFYSKPAGRDL